MEFPPDSAATMETVIYSTTQALPEGQKHQYYLVR